MPSAQSLSTVHGPGAHAITVVGVQAGGEGQGWLGAHAMSGQAVDPATSQVKPLGQSELTAQVVALARPANDMQVASAKNAPTRTGRKRLRFMVRCSSATRL
jgi:hypothetical protein